MSPSTPVKKSQVAFTNRAHKKFVKLEWYDKIFGEVVSVEQTVITGRKQSKRLETLDGEFGIDVVMKVRGVNYRTPFTITIQERFRGMDAWPFDDITFTEWNNMSGSPSEFYKICADYMVYAIYNENTVLTEPDEVFPRIAVVRMADLKELILCGGVEPTDHNINDRSQPFVGFKHDLLEEKGLIKYSHGWV